MGLSNCYHFIAFIIIAIADERIPTMTIGETQSLIVFTIKMNQLIIHYMHYTIGTYLQNGGCQPTHHHCLLQFQQPFQNFPDDCPSVLRVCSMELHTTLKQGFS